MPFGLTLLGRRNGDPQSYYWRITQWLFPWYTLIPPFGDHALGGHVWVPMDDHNCWAWSINFHPNKPLSDHERSEMQAGKGIHVEYEAPGSFRPKSNKDNDYLIDRVAQKEKRAYSGVFGFSAQDYSLQESMGAIQNHENERLLHTDKAIVMARKMLLESAQRLAEGIEPPALESASQRVRSAGVMLPKDTDPVQWVKEHLSDCNNHPVYSV
jgi:phthalate 4,5-dioxygenase